MAEQLTLVIGTRNEKKRKEIEGILACLPVRLRSLADYPDAPDVEEDAATFEGNARKKALSLAKALNEWVMADDSGLEVDALQGRPGVKSARYGGAGASDEDKCRKVLAELAGVPKEQRRARFRCVIAAAAPGEVLFTARGCSEGYIAEEMKGTGGFGYDPIFFYPDRRRTFGQMSADEKNRVSHRGRALEVFKAELRRRLRRGRPANGGNCMGKECAIGIDLGGTFIKGGVVDAEGNVVYGTSIDTQSDKGPEGVLERMAQLCRTVAGGAGIRWEQVRCVGVGSPGLLSTRDGIVYLAPNLPGWRNVRVVAALEEKLKRPVFLENDANAAAYAESWVGAGKGASSMLMLTLGTGIGGGIVLNGELWHGKDDVGGELGHMSINFDGPECNCGGRGCIEAYASAPATVRRALEGIEEGRQTSLKDILDRGEEITARAIYEAAVAGDEFAKETIQATGRFLGIAAASLVNIFNPELIVLFGGLAGAGEMLFEPARREMKRRALEPAAGTVRIVAARLGSDAGIIGAAGCALRRSETSA